MGKLIDKIKEISKDPKGKAFLFFGFYIVFFAIVFLFINLTDSTLTYGDDYEKSYSSYTYNLNNIFSNNYAFKYSVDLDNNVHSYIGAKKDDVETIKYNNLDYYRNGNTFLVNGTTWTNTSNPYVFSEYFDTLNIKKILENSYFVSKTMFENGTTSFNFAISSNTLNTLLYGINTDFDEVPNQVVIYTDNNKNVNKITFNLDSLCRNNKVCNYGLKINLEYEMFGEIEGIVNPMDN
jgi:hypothetical protein